MIKMPNNETIRVIRSAGAFAVIKKSRSRMKKLWDYRLGGEMHV
jgi:hypothetical protein